MSSLFRGCIGTVSLNGMIHHMAKQTLAGSSGTDVSWFWIGAALLGHTGWGSYPVFARYLQTVSNLPALAILSASNGVVLVLIGWYLWQHASASALRSPVVWLFALAVAGRGITNVLAARYTLALYVQMIALSTPFLVALLGATLFGERIPRYTLPAIAVSVLGGVLVLSDSSATSLLAVQLTPSDWLGIGLSLLSSLFLSFYMLLIRRSAQRALTGETMLLFQLITLTVVTGTLSALVGEDWSRWTTMQTSDWLVFAGFALGVMLGANVVQISTIRRLGAPFVSSMFGWRLVTTLVLGLLLLGERLTSLWQLLGVVLILTAVSLYVWYTATHPAPKEAR